MSIVALSFSRKAAARSRTLAVLSSLPAERFSSNRFRAASRREMLFPRQSQ